MGMPEPEMIPEAQSTTPLAIQRLNQTSDEKLHRQPEEDLEEQFRKKELDSNSGKHLLAHELTHVVQPMGTKLGKIQRRILYHSAEDFSPNLYPSVKKPIHPKEDKKPADTSRADKALDKWNRKTEEYIKGTRANLAENWIVYLGFTSSNPRLGWQEGFLYQIVSNTIGNAVSEATPLSIVKGMDRKVTSRLASKGGAVG